MKVKKIIRKIIKLKPKSFMKFLEYFNNEEARGTLERLGELERLKARRDALGKECRAIRESIDNLSRN